MSEWLSFTHPQVFFGATSFTEQFQLNHPIGFHQKVVGMWVKLTFRHPAVKLTFDGGPCLGDSSVMTRVLRMERLVREGDLDEPMMCFI